MWRYDLVRTRKACGSELDYVAHHTRSVSTPTTTILIITVIPSLGLNYLDHGIYEPQTSNPNFEILEKEILMYNTADFFEFVAENFNQHLALVQLFIG